MISVLTSDMLDVADIKSILSLYRDGYIHIEPNIKKVSIIDLGIKKDEIIAFSKFNYSINIFSDNFDLNRLLALNSDAYIIWGENSNFKYVNYLLEKVKKLISQKSLIGIGVGKEILESICKDLNEDEWISISGGKKHYKYKIHCLNNENLDQIRQAI